MIWERCCPSIRDVDLKYTCFALNTRQSSRAGSYISNCARFGWTSGQGQDRDNILEHRTPSISPSTKPSQFEMTNQMLYYGNKNPQGHRSHPHDRLSRWGGVRATRFHIVDVARDPLSTVEIEHAFGKHEAKRECLPLLIFRNKFLFVEHDPVTPSGGRPQPWPFKLGTCGGLDGILGEASKRENRDTVDIVGFCKGPHWRALTRNFRSFYGTPGSSDSFLSPMVNEKPTGLALQTEDSMRENVPCPTGSAASACDEESPSALPPPFHVPASNCLPPQLEVSSSSHSPIQSPYFPTVSSAWLLPFLAICFPSAVYGSGGGSARRHQLFLSLIDVGRAREGAGRVNLRLQYCHTFEEVRPKS
ncbi:hypothetical protein B0H14DRAFT_2604509 [Mycena olivaceomarginata]|nr:hypothetical protein B0H14DRAFT_2604509 [Mycena olivaceomarginata]